MAISPPKWASQCVPTTKGWQDPKTGEILVGGSISNAAIAEWHEARAPKPAPKKKASKNYKKSAYVKLLRKTRSYDATA